MKFNAPKETLLSALQEVSLVVPLRTTLPILGCALFEGDSQGILNIKSSDLEQTIIVKTTIKTQKNEQAALPVSKMLEIISALPNEDISIIIKEDFETEINSSTGKYKLIGKNPSEYPETPKNTNTQKHLISTKDFNDLTSKTVFAASKDDLKPALCGLYLNINNNEITAVATDGHRLVKYNKKNETKSTLNTSLVIPVKFFNVLKNQQTKEKEIVLEIGENHISATQGKTTTISRIIKDSFPDFNSVIPQEGTGCAKIDSQKLTTTLRRVSIFSNKITKQAVLAFSNNEITVSTEDKETRGFAKEHLECEYVGEEMKAGYNAQYLKEVVQHLFSKEIEMHLSGPLTAAVFKPTKQEKNTTLLSLLMPLRTQEDT